MEAARSKVMALFGNKENVIHLLLLGSVVALGARSAGQQREIEALEAERSSLRTGNKAMATALWDSRQHLFSLAEADPSAAPLPLSRLRAIFGEDPTLTPTANPGDNVVEESRRIA